MLTDSETEFTILRMKAVQSAAWLVLNTGVYLWAAPTMESLMGNPGGSPLLWSHLQDRLENYGKYREERP